MLNVGRVPCFFLTLHLKFTKFSILKHQFISFLFLINLATMKNNMASNLYNPRNGTSMTYELCESFQTKDY